MSSSTSAINSTSSTSAINSNGVYPTLPATSATNTTSVSVSAPKTEASTTSVPSPTPSTASSASTISSSTASASSSWVPAFFSNLWNNSPASAPTAPAAQAPAAAPATSTFRTALPYAIGSLALGAAGVIVAVTSLSTAAQIVGIVAAVVGIWAALGTVGCGVYYSGNPEGFKANWSKVVAVSVYHGAVEVLSQVLTQVIWRKVSGKA